MRFFSSSMFLKQYITLFNFCIGEGPKLKVFSKEGSLLCEDEVLPFNTVHGIQVGNDLLFRGCKRKASKHI